MWASLGKTLSDVSRRFSLKCSVVNRRVDVVRERGDVVKRKPNDRRVNRTRRSLSNALVGLIQEKRFDSITVQNVIDRADVGRSTFYAHFRGKEDLFLSGWKDLLDWVVDKIDWTKVEDGRCFPVRELFQHAQEFHPFYQALVRSRRTGLIFSAGLEYLTEKIECSLKLFMGNEWKPSAPVTVISNYVAAQLICALKWWLEHDRPYTVEQMDQTFHQLVMPGLRVAIGRVN